jgi:hypothetical protein
MSCNAQEIVDDMQMALEQLSAVMEGAEGIIGPVRPRIEPRDLNDPQAGRLHLRNIAQAMEREDLME